MPRTFVIADTHFGDAAIMDYEDRPFASTADMDYELIRNWNAVVAPEDTVLHLGDFGDPGKAYDLAGHIILIMGNHDAYSPDWYRANGFQEAYSLPVLWDEFWLLSHTPLYVNAHTPYANLFGHVHGSEVYNTVGPHHFCACVERIGYKPILLDDIRRQLMEKLTERKPLV